jgi:hypothetical protein
MECPICLEIINELQQIKTSCNHFFCKDCLIKWQKTEHNINRCPLCRKHIHDYSTFISIPTRIENHNVILTRSNESYDNYIRHISRSLSHKLFSIICFVALIFTFVILIFLL